MPEKIIHKKKEPLFHVIKRTNLKFYQSWLIRIGSVIFAMLLACLLLFIFTGASPVTVVSQMFKGCFGTPRRTWLLFREMSLLLIVGLALIPAFRMKFWNLGGNGQILIGALMSIICMKYMGEAGLPDYAIILVSIPSSILAGAIWAMIPAIFKAFFNTNESLFTLMMNYIAAGLVSAFIALVAKNGSGVITPIKYGHLPTVYNAHLLVILVAIVILILMFVYLRFSKHGYELEVVGESQNTARYIGINVKKVIIRTLFISGAICGVVGLLLAQGINYTITSESAKNMGFTSIMVAYLAKFNPLTMIITSFLVAFVNNGMNQVQTALSITNDSISNIVIGIIYFCVIASDFFVSYQVVLSNHIHKDKGSKGLSQLTENLKLINPFSKWKKNEKKEGN